MKKIISILLFILIAGCDLGDSDSDAGLEPTIPGTDVPLRFVGVYTGTLNVTAEAVGITESDSFPITITVTDDAMVRFDGDDPSETFTVGLENSGAFSGNLPIDEEDCSGTVGVKGSLDGFTAAGDVSGDGRCRVSGISFDVKLTGDFSAVK